jgi:hypothetical protein
MPSPIKKARRERTLQLQAKPDTITVITARVSSGERTMKNQPSGDGKFQFELDIPGRTCRNSDNEMLMPSGNPGVIIGYVDEVNGEGAKEIAGFVATRHELLELTKYWAQRVLDSEFFVFHTAQIGSDDLRIGPYGNRRIDRIAELIGKEPVDAVVKQVQDDFAKEQDPRIWEIFTRGDKAQYLAFDKEVARHNSLCGPPCRIENRIENHEIDFARIAQDTERFRANGCSIEE